MILASSTCCGGAKPWTPIGTWRIDEAESGYLEASDGTLRPAPSQAGGELAIAADGTARYRWPAVEAGIPSRPGPALDFRLASEGLGVAQSLKWTSVVDGVRLVGVEGAIWDYRRDGENRLKWSRVQGGVTIFEVWVRRE